MKNRLQFNRIPALFSSATTYLSGTSIGVSGRERAYEALDAFVKRRDFIPLIGEPIVARYIDDKGKKQLVLAIGKATGSTENDTAGVQYHIIDTAWLQEGIDVATDTANEALDLASAATKDTADYLIILKNMIMSGVGLSDGTYFDNNGRWDRDPSTVGLYDPIENSNYLSDPDEVRSMRDADKKLDEVLGLTNLSLNELSGATESLSGVTREYFNNIFEAAGLTTGEAGKYPGHDSTNYINSASSLDEADVILDSVLRALSANTVAGLEAADDKTNELSAVTAEFSATTDGFVNRMVTGAGLKENGEYKKDNNANYILRADSLADADSILDSVLAETADNLAALSAVTAEFSGATDGSIRELSAATQSFSGIAEEYFNNIIEAAGLANNKKGEYPDHDETHYIKDATSLDNADVILDQTIHGMSAATGEFSAATDSLIGNIIEAGGLNADGTYTHPHDSGEEVAYIGDASSLYESDIMLDQAVADLSANTMAADAALQEQIDEIGARKVLGENAIAVDVLDNGDSKVKLVINEEDDKVLTQNALGLKASVTLTYSRDDKKIYLNGKNGTPISKIDTDDFVKDGMLSAASVFTATEADKQQYPELVVGKTYIKLLFNVDGEEPGRANPVFISADDLVDIYTIDPELHPELHTFMKIDDYVIKLNVDAENGFASYNYARNISAVTANIISATGLNMGEQGSYPGHDETHYIKNAGSLDQADVLLDEAIWRVSGSNLELSASVVNNENVINNILKGTGLNTQEPGEYPGHDDTHFITSAKSLDNADVLLDQAIWGLSGVAGNLSAVTGDLSAVTGEFSAATDERLRNIISAASLNPDGTYDHARAHHSHYFASAFSSYEADEMLDANLWNLSGVILDLSAATESLSAGTLQLSADTYYAIQALSGDVIEYVDNSIKNLSGDVIGYVDESVRNLSGDVINYVDGVVSGFAGDIAALSARCDEIEETTAAALNDLNERVGVVETHFTGDYVTLQGFVPTSASSEDLKLDENDTVNEALAKLEKQIEEGGGALDKLAELSGAVQSFSSATYNQFNELGDDLSTLCAMTISLSGAVETVSGLTDGVLTITRNGVEQGTYSPSADTTVDIEVTGADVPLTGYELASGSTEEELTIVPEDTVNEAFGKLQKQAFDNEKVIAAAFNDLKDMIEDVSGTMFDGADYDSTTKEIRFYNGDTVIDTIDATAFIKDGMLDNVEVVTISGEKYLRFTFNTDAGKETIDIKVSDFAGLYTAGSGITVSDSNEISIKLADKGDTGFLRLDGDGLYLTGITDMSSDLRELSAATVHVEGDLYEFSGAVMDKELVIAAAFNDLNDRVLELEDGAEMLDHAVTFNIDGESHGSASTDLSGDQVNINTYKMYETAGSPTGLTLNEFLTIITVSDSGSLTIAQDGLPVLPTRGVKEAHILIQNESNDPVVITVDNTDDRLRITGDNKLYIEGNGIGEANALITYDGLAYTIYIIVS